MDIIDLKTVPNYVWIGAAVVVIILIGWYFNVWRVVGISKDFPYLEIAKPLPELHRLEPHALLSGGLLTLHGDKLEAFDPKSSRIVIGATSAKIINWDQNNKKIEVKVPEGIIPGKYPVSIHIGERQSAEKNELEIQLLPAALHAAVQKGQRILVLVAKFNRANEEGKIQNDLVEQLTFAAKKHPILQKKLLVCSWPEKIAGNIINNLESISELTHAQLILFGKLGTGDNFYPRIYSRTLISEVFTAGEQQLQPASLSQLNVTSADTYPFSTTPIKDPLQVIRFLLALSHFHLSEYDKASTQFSILLEEVGQEAISKASLYFALGRTQIRQGIDILEKPVRTDQDHNFGNSLLVKGSENLRNANELIDGNLDEKSFKAHIYLNLARVSQARIDTALKQKHEDAIELLKNALKFIDCTEKPSQCLVIYDNLGMSYEWLASTQWDISVKEDMLEESIMMSRKAIEMHEYLMEQNPQQPLSKQISTDTLEFQNAWLLNQLGIAVGHSYRGDRDKNLNNAIRYSEQALPIFKKHVKDMSGRIALTYNHIGHSYMLQEGDRKDLLPKALAAFDEGLTYVRTDYFPEFYNLLKGNKKTVERLIGLEFKMLEGESANRYAANIDKYMKEGNHELAEQKIVEFLNWSWREFRAPASFTAYAHTYMSQVAENANDIELALWHLMSARSIMSRYERVGGQDHHFISDIEKKIVEYLSNQGTSPWEIETILNGCRNGFAINSTNKDMGDQKLANDELQDAVTFYDKALYYYPYEPRALTNRSQARGLLGDIDGYVQDLQNALFFYPDDPIALYNSAQIYLKSEKWDKAIRDINRAFNNGAEKSAYFVSRAEAYLGLGNKKKALTDYKEALERTNNETERQDVLRQIDKLKSISAN
ncbi:MAG: hypothetical protein GY799_20530 [Desulfobulbaceae bacterium]|nr:hypothetical protein [Desulfobulbaceae bacterium]